VFRVAGADTLPVSLPPSTTHPPGVAPGDRFDDRKAVRQAGVHLPLVAGIDMRGGQIATSIVLNHGYVDDIDDGYEIIYTGEGGNRNGKQIADQEWTKGNLGLYRAMVHGTPVWVTRGPKLKITPIPTGGGYQYGGSYQVVEAWREEGEHGFQICRFRLLQNDGIELPEDTQLPVSPEAAVRIDAFVSRLVRNTALARQVKKLHGDTCQICGIGVQLPFDELYSEGAHVRPLGRPHNGPDALENLLCLCPNDHVRFDSGALVISDTLQVHDRVTRKVVALRTRPDHRLSANHLAYHRDLYI
jgi:putative restriction endonuclease